MAALRDRIFHYDRLHSVFHTLYHGTPKPKREVAGTDDVTIADFDRDSARRLRELSKRLSSQKFTFSPLRAVVVQKANKKDRLICVPTVEDRIVQRTILKWMSDDNRYGLDNGVSYGFIPGKGVETAASRAKELRKQHPYIYRTDITSFFDTIQRAKLNAKITNCVKHRSLRPFLFQVVECEIEPPSGEKARRIAKLGIRSGVGVRQGMPLSPFFSNLILSDFDQTLIAAGIKMVRYADDLIFFADSEDECARIHAMCVEELAKLGFTIPPISTDGKTQIFAPHVPADFLGVALVPHKDGGYRLEITKEQEQDIKRKIMEYGDGKRLIARGDTFTKFGRKFESALAGYRSAYGYCDNSSQFEKQLETWRAAALERLFTGWLGIPARMLTPEKRAFFELPAA